MAASPIGYDPGYQVPDMILDTAGMVEDMLTVAIDRSAEAYQEALTSINALQTAQLLEPLPDPPPAPGLSASFSRSLDFSTGSEPNLGTITPQPVSEYVPEEIAIPDFAESIRDYVPLITGLTIPEPPSFLLPSVPPEPTINTDYTVQDAPEPDYGLPPDLIDPDLPVFVAPVLPIYGLTTPTFTDQAPDPFLQWQEPVYTSDIKDDIAAVLAEMLAGGTGLPAEIERAIWERGAERESMAGTRQIQEANAIWATRGHEQPTGALNGQVIQILDDILRKGITLSREVSVKQAEMEQTNRQFAVSQGINYEQVFVGLFVQIVDRNFQIAKFGVESQIQVFNSQVLAFNARVAAFGAGIDAYKAQLEGALSELKVYAARVDAERVKGEINKIRLESFKAKIDAFTAQVMSYKALVESAAIQVQLEKNKVDVFRGQVDAYVGQINGQRAAFEAYDSRIKGESSKAQLEEANARAYTAYVQGVATRAELTFKDADVRMQKNRLLLDYAVANMGRLTQFTAQELNVIQANASSYQLKTNREVASFNANLEESRSEMQTTVELSRNYIARYQAMIEAWKAQATQILAVANINIESMRSAGQIAATLAAGSMSATHASVGMSAGATSGQTATRSEQFQQSTSTSDASHYNETHQYSHRV